MNYHQSIMKMIEILIKKFIEQDQSGIKISEKLQPFSFSELMILVELSRTECMTTQELLKSLQVDRGIMSTLINRLMAQKLLEKSRGGKDKRKSYVMLTELGRQYFDQVNVSENEAFQFVMNDLSINEQQAILKFLSRINQLTVGKYEDFEINI